MLWTCRVKSLVKVRSKVLKFRVLNRISCIFIGEFQLIKSMSDQDELFSCILSAYEQWGIADNSTQTQQRDPYIVSTPVEHTSLVHPRSFPCYVSWVQVPESCHPLLSCLIFRPLFLAKLSNWYHGAHTKSEGRFTLAPKVTPDPDRG